MIFKPSLDEQVDTRVIIDYTNWRGERYEREITPHSIECGSNQWHSKPQFLMLAWCHRSKANKCFAVNKIHSWREA